MVRDLVSKSEALIMTLLGTPCLFGTSTSELELFGRMSNSEGSGVRSLCVASNLSENSICAIEGFVPGKVESHIFSESIWSL